jgi:patatin-related protein
MDEPTTVARESATSPSTDDDMNRQEIRLAVVLNGGVSLAVWISGVTLELHHLAMAEQKGEQTYGPLLNLLNADAHIDVIAGTSAGGLNGAFLALGVSRGRDLARLRDLWREHGSLEKLLRNPLSKNPPSLLEGDDYFLPHVRDALAKITKESLVGSRGRHVDLILTGTLWQGRTTSFTDDLGAGITELDHDARFQFALNSADGPVPDDDQLIKKLAAAARCTSSFPGAFEPHFVRVDESTKKVTHGPDSMWDSGAGDANFAQSQFVVDGGVLLNKPIRPALEAIYRQTAEAQVRRILAYVAPTADDPRVSEQSEEDIPPAREVVLGVLTRLRATDSVSRELAEIRTHNVEARDRRRTRDRLAAAVVDVAEKLSAGAWPAYIEVRINYAARTIGRLLAAGQNPTSSRWSERELISAVQRLWWAWRKANRQFFIPSGDDLEQAVQREGAEWDWGFTTVQRLGDMAVDVLKRALWLAPLNSPSREAIVNARKTLKITLDKVCAGRRSLDDFWSSAPTRKGKHIPTRGDAVENLHTPTEDAATELMEWLNDLVAKWDQALESEEQDQLVIPTMIDRRRALFKHALAIATCLHSCASDVAALTGQTRPADASSLEAEQAIDPEGLERDRLQALYKYLFEPWKSSEMPPGPQEVLEHMLRLDVVQLAFAGASAEVEQEVELVQFAATNREQLTGVQLHHFGAFYRSSWRMNDWLHGRMDGAVHVVRALLSAERLRQRAAEIARVKHKEQTVVALLEDVKRAALCTDNDLDRDWLRQRWDDDKESCRLSIESIVKKPQPIQIPRDHDGNGAPVEEAMTVSLDAPSREGDVLRSCAKVITRSIQTQILRQDLSALADAIRSEGDDCAPSSQAWLASYDAIAHERAVQTAELWRLWEAAAAVGKERITAELGSDTLARTASQTAAVAANNISALTKPKAVTTVLAALRGYVLAVWVMVTFLTGDGNFGRRVVELSVAAGGVLLAVAILVPGMPLAFTLAGGLLLLAGVSAAALLTPEARGVGLRVAGCLVLVLAVLAGDAYREWGPASSSSEAAGAKQQAAIWSVAVKVGIAFLVVFLGWWIARARPGKSIDRRRGRKAGRSAALVEVDKAIAQAREADEKAGKNAGEKVDEDAGQRFARPAAARTGRENGAMAGAAAGKRRARRLRKVAARAGAEAGAKAGGKAGAFARASGDDWRTIWPDLTDFTEISEAAGHMAGTKAGHKVVRAAGDSKTVWDKAGREAGWKAVGEAGEMAGHKASEGDEEGETRQSLHPDAAREVAAGQ